MTPPDALFRGQACASGGFRDPSFSGRESHGERSFLGRAHERAYRKGGGVGRGACLAFVAGRCEKASVGHMCVLVGRPSGMFTGRERVDDDPKIKDADATQGDVLDGTARGVCRWRQVSRQVAGSIFWASDFREGGLCCLVPASCCLLRWGFGDWTGATAVWGTSGRRSSWLAGFARKEGKRQGRCPDRTYRLPRLALTQGMGHGFENLVPPISKQKRSRDGHDGPAFLSRVAALRRPDSIQTGWECQCAS